MKMNIPNSVHTALSLAEAAIKTNVGRARDIQTTTLQFLQTDMVWHTDYKKPSEIEKKEGQPLETWETVLSETEAATSGNNQFWNSGFTTLNFKMESEYTWLMKDDPNIQANMIHGQIEISMRLFRQNLRHSHTPWRLHHLKIMHPELGNGNRATFYQGEKFFLPGLDSEWLPDALGHTKMFNRYSNKQADVAGPESVHALKEFLRRIQGDTKPTPLP